MGRLSEETVVAALPEAAFAYVTDQSHVADWSDHVPAAEAEGDGPVVVARLRQHRRRNNREFTPTSGPRMGLRPISSR